MNNILRYTLLTDGSSDRTLIPVINWLLNDLYPQLACEKSFADFRTIPNPPRNGDVAMRIKYTKHYFPFDILFYHRDAEKNTKQILNQRKQEISEKIDDPTLCKVVCIIPVKMMESWLMVDKEAIKKAAGNRNYKGNIDLPPLSKIESLSDPKAKLHEILCTTSGLTGRRLKVFTANDLQYAVHLVAENISDFSPLRQLPAFREFEKELTEKVNQFLKK